MPEYIRFYNAYGKKSGIIRKLEIITIKKSAKNIPNAR